MNHKDGQPSYVQYLHISLLQEYVELICLKSKTTNNGEDNQLTSNIKSKRQFCSQGREQEVILNLNEPALH
jgi:hypothetical protein